MIKTWNLTIPRLTGAQPRRAYVYVPDAWYSDRSQRYPVLYMFDGHNVFFDQDATYGKSWGMAEYAQNTGLPMIIAAVECNHDPDNGRLHEYSPFSCYVPELGGWLKGKGKTTMDWFVYCFKQSIDRHYPTLPDRRHTFIAGSSMGGLMSLYAVTRYNKYFSRAAALSPSVWFASEQLQQLLSFSHIRPDTVVYMDYGSEELKNHPGMLQCYCKTASLLMEQGVHLTSRIVPGGSHSEASWERQIPFFMETLLYNLD